MRTIPVCFRQWALYGLLGLSMSACTWVKKSPEAAAVRLVPQDRVADCQSMGKVTTTTMGNVTVFKRKASKVAKELESLAQQEAVNSGADTIVAVSEVVDGMQSFTMHKCL